MTGDHTWRMTRRLSLLACTALLAACATPRAPQVGQAAWTGRLGLQVHSLPPQSVSVGFELTGSPQAGELALTSPLGNTLATVRWAPGQAELQRGGQVMRRDSLDELTTELGGTALPVAALFAWLRGQPEAAAGWEADLSRQPEGRINARRLTPEPAAELRIIFEP